MSKPSQTYVIGNEKEVRRDRSAGLLLFDLDDTIVQGGSHVSKRVLSTLKKARESGYVLSLASGRPLPIVNKQVLSTGAMAYAVCANGATVTRLTDGAVISHRPMPREDALACHKMLASFKPAWNAFYGAHAYFEWKGASYMLVGRTGAAARVRRYANVQKGSARQLASIAWRGARFVGRMTFDRNHRQVLSILPHIRRAAQGVDKMGCTIMDADDCALAKHMLEEDGRFEVVSMGATELEITRRGVTKGTGAERLIEALGMEPQDATAFGDGGNDLPLASAVGRFVAMGNADDEVKAAADDVCPSVDEDGVAVWIEQHLLRA